MLENSIKKITDGVYPFHMPGHKRQKEWLDGLTDCDITEISGADDLHAPAGIIKDAQSRARELFGSVATIFLTGGSTAGILSAISAVCDFGHKIIIARNCHKSVYNACKINRLCTEYVYPTVKHRIGAFGEVLPADIDAAMKKSGAKAVVITSPTYEGIVSDIKTISKVVHKNGGILIVDSAHGAHLGFNDYFPKSARSLGADIVVESAHKTLPCLTGAALLHICSHRVSYMLVREKLATFETSSPPYPILSSIDRALTKIATEDLFTPYIKRLEAFSPAVKDLRHLCIFKSAEFDSGKIVISTENADISGFELKKILLDRYKIELEMAMPNFALAMTSIADTDEGFERLADALIDIDGTLSPAKKQPLFAPPVLEKVFDAFEGKTETLVSAENSLKKISAEYILAYPPGSPIIAPGEVITREVLDYLGYLYSSGAQILSTYGKFPDSIAIFEEKD